MSKSRSATLRECGIDFYRKVQSSDLPTAAASLAYTTILSIIPMLAMSLALFKAFGGLDRLYLTLKPIIFDSLAEGTDEKVTGMLDAFVQNAHASALGLGGLLGLVITSFLMLAKAETSINRVWGVISKRSLFSRLAGYWFFVTLGPLLIGALVALASSTIATSGATDALSFLRWIPSQGARFGLSILIFFAIYRWVPATKVDHRPALIAAVYATVCWQLARFGYDFYTRTFITTSKIYGSLGAVPILLVWIYLNWLVLLSGAALTAVLQQRVLGPSGKK